MFDVVVAGTSLTGLFLAKLLAGLGVDVLLIGPKRPTLADPLTVFGQRATLLPVLPVRQIDTYPANLCARQTTLVRFDIDTSYDNTEDTHCLAGSFLANSPNRMTRALALKQYGPITQERALQNVADKVSRWYGVGSNTTPNRERAGFVDGTSEYHLASREPFQVDRLFESIASIDLNKRSILTTTGTSLSYRKLVFTSSRNSFRFLAGLHRSATYSAPVHIRVFRLRNDHCPNQIWYDSRIESPIFRFYFPTEQLVVAHLAAGAHRLRSSNVQTVLRELELDIDDSHPSVALTRQDAYPIDADDDCGVPSEHTNSVRLFGRFAEWKYLDLDELDWSGISKWVSTFD